MKIIQVLIGLVVLWWGEAAQADTTWVASGNVSGVWPASGSPYVVHGGDITVVTGEALQIEPGVRVYFAGSFKMVINGLLQAIGTESDSIWFTGDASGFPYDSPTRWRGLRFVDADADCELRYCSITYSGATGPGALSYGGGLYCYNTDLEIARSRIHHCHAGGSPANAGGGCGAYFEQSDVELEYTDITHNGGTVYGDGYVYNTKGGGFATLNATIHLRHCKIQSNRPGIVIGGLYLREGTVATIDTCLIDDNQTPDGGLGGVMAEPTSVVSLTGTTISNHHAAFGFDGACGVSARR
ncbi:MAG: right-handed parallel beta-helix repeat-containing protein [bacterium]|nr:right-handed parallel beta-helix repeat-containing protein [bacterium]